MRQITHKTRLLAASVLTLSSLSLVGMPLAQAATATPAAPVTGSASGLSISPLRQDLTLNPGQADTIAVTLKNITGGPIIAEPTIKDFTSDNSTGNPKILNSDPNNPASIASFISGLGNIKMAAGQQITLSVPAKAPANASPGAYYGLIAYQAVPDTGTAAGNNQVALSAAVSQLVFITVPGQVNQRLQINNVHVYHDTKGTSEGTFFTTKPQSVGVELHNYGNAFATPFGSVVLKDSSGKQVYTYEVNGGITRGLILPNSSRIFINPLKGISRPGRYTLTVSVSYGNGSSILTAKKTFWYIQTWLLIAIIVVIVLLILAIIYVRYRFKRGGQKRYSKK